MSDLTIENLSMRFDLPNGTHVQALQDINLEIKTGEIMSVLGQKLPNVGPLKHWTRYRKAPDFAPRSLHELAKKNGVDNE